MSSFGSFSVGDGSGGGTDGLEFEREGSQVLGQVSEEEADGGRRRGADWQDVTPFSPPPLFAILNWATRSRDEEGRLLLDSNPIRGLKTPSEKNPIRVMLTQAEYEALLRVAREVEWRFRVALVLAHETRHRIGAIRQLRWSDIDSMPGQSGDVASMGRPDTSTGRRSPPWHELRSLKRGGTILGSATRP